MAVFNIRMRKFNGTDWDVLHPLTVANNVTTSSGKTVEQELNATFDKIATSTTNGVMSAADKKKLDSIEPNANNYIHPNNASTRHVTDSQISLWNDKYTKLEIDNKFNELNVGLDWKESVETFDDIATIYPNPQDGWTVNTKDTDITYRYTGTAWIAISANAIPLASQTTDGKMSKIDKKTLDELVAKVTDLEEDFSSLGNGMTGDLSEIISRITNAEKSIENINTDMEFIELNKSNVNHNHDSSYVNKTEFESIKSDFDSIKDKIIQNKPIVINNDTPIGTIIYRDKDSDLPDGWLICDGRSLSTTEYSDLFSVIKYKHGGSGNTFKLPNINGNDIIVSTDEDNEVINNIIVGQVAIIKARNLNIQGQDLAEEISTLKIDLNNTNEQLEKVKVQASHTHDYLPLIGGTLTGNLTIGTNQLRGANNTTILKDFGNGNVTISAGVSSSGTPGALYLGYNLGSDYKTSSVRLESTLTWKGMHTIVNSNGYIPWSAISDVPNMGNDTINGDLKVNGEIFINGTNKVYHPGNKPTPADIGAAAASHTHNYAGSSSAGGAATSALACTGNSVTATTLQTARTINGTSFNGSANITTANWGTARTITIGSTGKSVNGSANVSWSLAEIGAAAASHNHNGVYTRKYTANIGDGSSTTIAVTHNLGTEDITVSVVEVATKQIVMADIQIVNTNSINVLFASAPASGAYRVIVVG